MAVSSDNLIARTRAAVWHPCTQMRHLDTVPPLAVARGDGAYLIDPDGRRFFDGISSWWVNLFGHNHPRINAAIVDQLGQIAHVMLAGATHAPVVELSERLAALSGLGHAFYGSDGASATEIALKMSAHFWKNSGRPRKNTYLSLRNGYHGETVGALAVTDIPLFKSTYADLLRPGAHIATPDARLAEPGESAEAYAHRCADELEAYFAQHADTLAAFIVEPLVQGAAGMAMYHPAYLARVRALCTRYAVHYIADEIAVGFGRTGTMFAFEQALCPPLPHTRRPGGLGTRAGEGLGVRGAFAPRAQAAPPRLTPDASRLTALAPPDFLCLSKGITGGYLPLAAVLTTDTVYAAFLDDATARGFLHSHSYTGNPLACRAALAVLDIFESDDTLATNAVNARAFSALLAPVAAHPRVRHFRHTGMIWAFDVVDAAPGFAADFHQKLLAHGVFLRPIGHTVYLMPPYISTADDIAHVTAALLACLA